VSFINNTWLIIWYKFSAIFGNAPVIVYRGIRNVIRWAPVIFTDRDYDFAYIYIILRFKLKCVRGEMDEEVAIRQLELCEEILDRLIAEDYKETLSYKYIQKKDHAALFKILKENIESWWT